MGVLVIVDVLIFCALTHTPVQQYHIYHYRLETALSPECSSEINPAPTRSKLATRFGL